MSSSSSTTRRKLDFGRKRGPTLSSAAAANRTLSGSFSDTNEIIAPGALKNCIDFHRSDTLQEDQKSQQESQDLAHATDIRNMVAAGLPETNQAEYSALVRDTLYKRAEEQLKADEWIFSRCVEETEV